MIRCLRVLQFHFFVLSPLIFFGQDFNLVPNPGFEEFSRCPGTYSHRAPEFSALHWSSPATLGTPDHFHACSAGEADVPHNWAGISDAYEGDGFAGIFLWMFTGYREYIQSALKEPLLRDSLYHIRFRYKLSLYSKYSIDRIGLLLLDSALSVRRADVIAIPPTLAVIQDSALTEYTGLWEEASFEYTARGGERYIVIGNFSDNAETRTCRIRFRDIQELMLANAAYYYIDLVEVIPAYRLGEIPQLLPEFTPGAEMNITYVLKNIRFEFDQYKLRPISFTELDQVVEYLNKHPAAQVHLYGHTDDVGSESYNERLSINRARSVARYLEHAGIGAHRINTFGYGKARPLLEEKSEYARSVNRRVEIKFLQ